MSIQFSSVIAAEAQGDGVNFTTQRIDLSGLGERASPVVILDRFRVKGRPFGPHPHAGFSAITYMLEDSEGSGRSRDSLGNDYLVGPGEICWAQAGRGMMHDEVPADPKRALHGMQIFVNLSRKNKLVPPHTFWLKKSEVPEWRNEAGDRVCIVVGSYQGLSSPLVPAEPFTFLDVELRGAISFTLPGAHNALVYVLSGRVLLRADGTEQGISADHAVAFYGSGGDVTFEAPQPAHLLVLSGREIREPVLEHGPFVMNDEAQIEAAIARYKAGEMGRLTRLPE